MRIKRHIKLFIDLREPLVARQASVTSKAPAKTRLPRVGGDLAAQTSDNNKCLEHNCASLIPKSAVKQLEYRNIGGSSSDLREIANNAEEHGNRVEPRGSETDSDSAHDRNWDHLLWPRDFLSHVRRAIKACECPVGVDQSHDECDAILRPACVVDEGSEDEFGVLVGGCAGGHCDHNNEEGEEGAVQREAGDCGKGLAIAIEEVAEEVDDLVCNNNVPRLNYTK